jgi:O-antigen/teichoic acid export membrane protein
MLIKKIFNFLLTKKNYGNLLIDQAIVSAGNFILSIIILRFLGIEAFGLFSFLWLLLLLINSIQLSYIISPMLTNAPKQDNSKIDFFYGGVFLQQVVFSISSCLITFFIIRSFGNFISAFPIYEYCTSFSLLIVFTQLQQFFRRLFFSKKLYLRAIISDLSTYFLIITFIIYFNYLDKLNLQIVFWSFTIAFLIGTIISFPIIFTLNYKLKNTFASIRENWIIGKWMLLTSIIHWFSGNLWVVNAGLILGPYIFGIFRACQTLLNVINLIFQSLENIIPMKASQIYSSSNVNNMRIFLRKFTTQGFFVVSIISFIIILFSKFLLNVFYGAETSNYYQYLIYLSLILPITFLTYPSTYGLRTIEKTKPIFISFLLSSIFAILLSRYVIMQFQLNGLIAGLFLSQAIIASCLYFSFLFYIKSKKKNKS